MKNYPRIDYLDCLRGLAALFVFFSHFLSATDYPPGLPMWVWFSPLSFPINGRGAVSLFYVLSGLVLVLPYLSQGKNYDLKRELIPFALSRLIRILIPFGVVLTVSFVANRTCYLIEKNSLIPISSWAEQVWIKDCLLYTSPSPRDLSTSRMPSSA